METKKIYARIYYRNQKKIKKMRTRTVNIRWLAMMALREAIATGKVVVEADHGGDVANAYKYPANTQGCVTTAWPDGRVLVVTDVLPANKVTLAGVARRCTGHGMMFDERCSATHQEEAKKRWIDEAESIYAQHPNLSYYLWDIKIEKEMVGKEMVGNETV